MAYLTLNTKFKPFSYQERLAPYLPYIEDYRAQQQSLDELTTKSGAIEGFIENSPIAQKQYDTYQQNLAEQAEILMQQGLTSANRQGLTNIKKRYNTEIVPIEAAYKRRAEDIKIASDLMAKGYEVERDPTLASLDNYLTDNTYNYGKTLNVNQLIDELSKEYSNMSRVAQTNPTEFKKILEEQYYQAINQLGYTEKQVQQAMDSGDTSLLRKILMQKVAGTGYDTWEGFRDKTTKQLTDYGTQKLSNLFNRLEGTMTNAIGKTTSKEISNKAYDYAMQDAARRKTQKPDTLNFVNPKHIYTQKEMDTRKKDNENMQLLKSVIGKNNGSEFNLHKDGSIDFSKIDMEQLFKASKKPTKQFNTLTGLYNNLELDEDQKIYQILEPFITTTTDSKGNAQMNLDATAASKFYQDLEAYDATITNATSNLYYDFPIDEETSEALSNKIISSADFNSISKAIYTTDQGYISGENVDLTEALGDDKVIIEQQVALGKNVIKVKDKNTLETEIYTLPEGINPVAEKNISENFPLLQEKDRFLFSKETQNLLNAYDAGRIPAEILADPKVAKNIEKATKVREERDEIVSKLMDNAAILSQRNSVKKTILEGTNY